jgi:preprotein translocase subunit YajC
MSKKKAAHLHEVLSEAIKVGDSVKLINSRQPGEVTEIKGEKYTISFGVIKTTVGREKIILANRSL